jgi:hypothetical protein
MGSRWIAADWGGGGLFFGVAVWFVGEFSPVHAPKRRDTRATTGNYRGGGDGSGKDKSRIAQ